MTLLLFDGFDQPLLMPKPGFQDGGNTSAAQNGRDGSTNGAYRCSSNSGGPIWTYTLPSAAPTIVVGFAFYMTALSGIRIIRLYNVAGGSTVQLAVFVNVSTGRYELRQGDTTIVAQSAPGVVYTPNTWTHFQLKAQLHTSSGTAIVRINNVEVINYSGATALTSGDVTSFAGNASSGGSSYAVDDLWVCDTVDATLTQGRTNNDFLGDLKVVTIVPTGAGDSTQWTPSTGSNWATLDENPVSPTADYVAESGGTTGDQDLYAASDLAGTASTVLAFQSKAYALKSDSGSASFKQIIKENSTVSTLSTHAPGTTVQGYYSSLITQRPSDSSNLTVADVNSMQIGVEVA